MRLELVRPSHWNWSDPATGTGQTQPLELVRPSHWNWSDPATGTGQTQPRFLVLAGLVEPHTLPGTNIQVPYYLVPYRVPYLVPYYAYMAQGVKRGDVDSTAVYDMRAHASE